MTGYSDFEGYKLYRSRDGGVTWGTIIPADIDGDGSGEIVGWQPIEIFDLNRAQDVSKCVYYNGYWDIDALDDIKLFDFEAV